MTRNIPLNQRELSLVLSVFEGKPLPIVTGDQVKERNAIYDKFRMSYDGVVAVEEIIASLPEDFRHKVYDTYHSQGPYQGIKGKIPATKLVYDLLGKKSPIEAKQVAEAIAGEISS